MWPEFPGFGVVRVEHRWVVYGSPEEDVFALWVSMIDSAGPTDFWV